MLHACHKKELNTLYTCTILHSSAADGKDLTTDPSHDAEFLTVAILLIEPVELQYHSNTHRAGVGRYSAPCATAEVDYGFHAARWQSPQTQGLEQS